MHTILLVGSNLGVTLRLLFSHWCLNSHLFSLGIFQFMHPVSNNDAVNYNLYWLSFSADFFRVVSMGTGCVRHGRFLIR